MNKIFRALTGQAKHERYPTAKVETKYPLVYVFDSVGLCIGTFHRDDVVMDDDQGFAQKAQALYPAAKSINIKHRNGKVSVVRL